MITSPQSLQEINRALNLAAKRERKTFHVCAWCGVTLQEIPCPTGRPGISHGICPTCKDVMLLGITPKN